MILVIDRANNVSYLASFLKFGGTITDRADQMIHVANLEVTEGAAPPTVTVDVTKTDWQLSPVTSWTSKSLEHTKAVVATKFPTVERTHTIEGWVTKTNYISQFVTATRINTVKFTNHMTVTATIANTNTIVAGTHSVTRTLTNWQNTVTITQTKYNTATSTWTENWNTRTRWQNSLTASIGSTKVLTRTATVIYSKTITASAIATKFLTVTVSPCIATVTNYFTVTAVSHACCDDCICLAETTETTAINCNQGVGCGTWTGQCNYIKDSGPYGSPKECDDATGCGEQDPAPDTINNYVLDGFNCLE